ncbi:MAG: hypothetical protein HY769_05880, partial [Candidatus Stahlbacteria bacterium]|nr:hypothetical protein [Candidatus Stahlbacteria bacterium]
MNKLRDMGLLMVMLFSIRLTGEVIEFSGSWEREGISLVSENPNGVEIVFSIHKLTLGERNIKGESMTELSIPGVIIPNDEGAPNLPGMGRWIAIPQGAIANVEVISSRKEVYQNIAIAPAPNLPLNIEGSEMVYKKDITIYGKNAYYPAEPVRLSKNRSIRGVDAVILGITPFQYNPVTKELVVYRDLRIRVSWSGGNGHFGADRLRNRFWEPVLQSNLINYSSLPQIDFNDKEKYKGYGYEYVIITPNDPAFISWADTIKNWRNLTGIKTKVVNLSEIGGNNRDKIKTFIDTAYTNWAVPPVAVLLLSDYINSAGLGITSYTTIGMFWLLVTSDNYYADIDED